MKLTGDIPPPNSILLRGWYDEHDGTPDSGEPIDLVAFLIPVGDGKCRVEAAKGKINNEMMIRIGLLAIEHKYTELEFRRKAGGKGPRWAVKVHTEDGFDYFWSDLLAQLDRYKRSF